MADFEKKFAQHRVGPGGMKCPCCGGAAHGKHKRELLRHLKHSAHHIIRADMARELREVAADVRDLDEDFNRGNEDWHH